MENSPTFDKIVDILYDEAIIPETMGRDEITPETSIVDDLKADSLDVVEVVMEIEERFGIDIQEDELKGMENIGDLVRVVEVLRAELVIG